MHQIELLYRQLEKLVALHRGERVGKLALLLTIDKHIQTMDALLLDEAS